MLQSSSRIRPVAVLLVAALAAATVVSTASVASAAPPGANMEGTGPQPKGQGLGSKAALTQDSCDSATGRTNFEVVGGGPWCVTPRPQGKDNGGATAPAVTATEVKVVVYLPPKSVVLVESGQGRARRTAPPATSATVEEAIRRHVSMFRLRVSDQYGSYQLWGRTPVCSRWSTCRAPTRRPACSMLCRDRQSWPLHGDGPRRRDDRLASVLAAELAEP